jgi:hypothetical protein
MVGDEADAPTRHGVVRAVEEDLDAGADGGPGLGRRGQGGAGGEGEEACGEHEGR